MCTASKLKVNGCKDLAKLVLQADAAFKVTMWSY